MLFGSERPTECGKDSCGIDDVYAVIIYHHYAISEYERIKNGEKSISSHKNHQI